MSRRACAALLLLLLPVYYIVSQSTLSCTQSSELGAEKAREDQELLPWFSVGAGYSGLLGATTFLLTGEESKGFLAGFAATVVTVSLAAASEPALTSIPDSATVDRKCYLQGYRDRMRMVNLVAAAAGGIVGSLLSSISTYISR